MKLIILLALIAFAAAYPADEKKEKVAEDKKPAEKPQEESGKKPAQDDAKKPVEPKKDDDRHGLQWPLPDPINEGDLMLHGVHLFNRVDELRKIAKLENDMDKMVLSVGRDYLRRVHRYLEKEKEFKIVSVLCRDSIALNSSRRWEIRIRPEQQPAQQPEQKPQTAESQDQEKEKEAKQAGEQQPKHQQQQDLPKPKEQTNLTNSENVTDAPIATTIKPERETYEVRRAEHYERMGDNFARLLLRKFRKEKLIVEETEYLERWVSDESVHFGVMSIFCHDGENIKETTKRIATLIDEKQ